MKLSHIHPSSPRVTSYRHGRIELSGATIDNWTAKVVNFFASMSLSPGDSIILDADTDWLPMMIAIGAWRYGLSITDDSSSADIYIGDDPDTSSTASEIFLLSHDPFGRGIEESGAELPFGFRDFSPELRIQPDSLLQVPAPDLSSEFYPLLPDMTRQKYEENHQRIKDLSAGEEHPRIIIPPSLTPLSRVEQLYYCLLPLYAGASIILPPDSTEEELQILGEKEKALILYPPYYYA